MYRKLLSKSFFANNPYKEVSAARIAYTTFLNDKIEELASRYTERVISSERMEQVQSERSMIENETNPEMLVKYLRRKIDVLNRSVLIKKALEYEEEILPVVAHLLVTTGNDDFVENGIRLLARSREDYTAPLVKRYDEIRDPYTQSMLCVVFGMRGEEAVIPWLYEKYFETKQQYPDETYSEGPLLALYNMKARFYTK